MRVIDISLESSARQVRQSTYRPNTRNMYTFEYLVAERIITVVTNTGSGRAAATEHQIYLTLIGSNGKSCDEFLLQGNNILQIGQ